ncbi:MAG: hypothetical protein HY898_01705 [Deltaproteobacteria bacterium]|nr:hypothetical protein [Deltaproteobacteria bacterium]
MRARLGPAFAMIVACACVEPAPKHATPPAPSSSAAPEAAARRIPTPGVTQQVMEIDADATRGTLVIATSDRALVIIRGGVQRSWPMKELMDAGSCGLKSDAMLGYLRIGVSADGAQAWFLGMDGSKRPPIRTLSAACLVDTQSGAARSLSAELGNPSHLDPVRVEADGLASIALGPKLAVLWGGRSELEAVWRVSRRIDRLITGERDGACAVVEAGNELVVGCVASREQGRVTLLRFDIAASPPKPITRHEIQLRAKFPEIQMSADGRFLGFYQPMVSADAASFMGVIDTGDGHVAFEREARPPVRAMEFVGGADALLVAQDNGPLRLLRVDGHPEGRFGFNCTPRRLLAQTGSRRLWCAGYSALGLYKY